jgi:hypothetical protein
MKKFYIVLIGLFFGLSTGFVANAQQTWYAINSGEWTESENWTLDPAAAIHITEEEGYPLAGDNVVIKSGKNITMPEQTGETPFIASCNVLTVDGRLDLKDTEGHSFSEIRGTGRILMEGDNFPNGNASHFVGEGQGTVVFEGGDYTISSNTFYNVEINSTSQVNLAGVLEVNGNFSVLTGNFQFGNDAISRTLTVDGDVVVNSGASMTVTTAGVHNMYAKGNITNNGIIKFTNLPQPDYDSTPSNGYVILTATGESNTTLTANNTTFLQRLIIDKGSDRTYRFTVNPAQKQYFRLFGQNNNAVANKALVINYGTLELTGATYIHSLTEGTDFGVPVTGGFWINGGAVEVNSTAISNAADGFSSEGVNASTSSGAQSLTVLGHFRISDGLLNTRSHGFVAWDEGNALVQIEGGTVKTPGFRSGGNNTGKWTYNQSGGKVQMFGDIDSDLEDSDAATFDIKGENNVFIMSGGEMEIYDAVTTSDYIDLGFIRIKYNTVHIAINIESGQGNYSVAGGTVKLIRGTGSNDENFVVDSSVPFFNFEVGGSANATNVYLAQQLNVLNNLSVKINGLFDVVNEENQYDLEVGGNLTIENGGEYNPHSNVTTFNGGRDAIITNNSGSVLSFHDLKINKEVNINGNYEVSVSGSNGVEINDDLAIDRGDFNVGDKIIPLKGDIAIYKGGISGTGKLVLNGSAMQSVFSDNGKKYSVGNIDFDNRTGSGNNIQVLSNVLAGEVRVIRNITNRQIIDIGRYNFEAQSADFTSGTWSNTRMFKTTGKASDGGLTLPVLVSGNFNNDLMQRFPLGYSNTYVFNEVYANGNSLNADGKLTVVPVEGAHPSQSDGGNGALPFYFRVKKIGLSTIDGGNLNYVFRFPATWSGNSWKGVVLNNYNWEEYDISKVFTGNNPAYTDTKYQNNIALPLEGDYTVGNKSSFNGITVYYSKASGSWNESGTWTTSDTHIGTASGPPQQYDVAVIGGANGENHVVSIVDDNESVSQVEIKGSSETGIGGTPPTLKMVNQNGNASIPLIKGRGRIIYPNNQYINGNHAEFCNNAESIIEFNGSGRRLEYNEDVPFFPNLHFTGSGDWIGPDEDLIVYGNLYVDSLNSGVNFTLQKDALVEGDVKIGNGTLFFPQNFGADFTIGGDIKFEGSGTFSYGNGNNAPKHNLFLNGNIYQGTGKIDFYGGNENAKNVTLYFQGDESVVVNKTGTGITDLFKVVVLKPVGQTVQFNAGFTLGADASVTEKPLNLQSGIAHLNSADIELTLSTGGADFKIPSASELIVEGSTVSLSGNTGLWLDGKLTVNENGIANLNEGTNNYIEYTSFGKSEIEVNGNGKLYVGSQVRRSLNTEAGILIFSQNDARSTVVIGDVVSPATTRGIFEILNSGSSFTQAAGAKLTIKNSKDGEFTDFYFDPETVSLGDGSAINIAGGTETIEPFNMYLNKPLENLTFTGAVVGELQTVSAEMLGDVTIGSGSEFDANGLDVTIHGNMTNEGTYSANGNTTFFNGTADQTITGTTAFYNLEKNGGAETLQVGEATSVTVNNDLTLLSGVLNTGENDFNVEGDATIAEGTSTESTGGNGIVMNGTSAQNLYGGGTIARMMIDNGAGVVVPTQSSEITFSEVLKLNQGVFDIGKNLLAFTEEATITGGGDPASFSSNNMIQTNISFTDAGIIKYYPVVDSNNSPYNFTYPIGARGKYTPVVMDVTDNADAGGSIRITAADEPHVTVIDPGNALNYNWTLDAVNLTGFSAHVTMDAQATDAPGDTDNYILARIRANDSKWEKGLFENFSLVENNSIARLYFRLENGNISGDYTAGTIDAIPNNVPVYKTIQTGDWNNGNIWEKYEDGVATGVTGEVPEGSIVYIKHPVTISANGRSAFRTIINEVVDDNGILNLAATLNHRLGAVSGTGKLVAESGSLPAGKYVDFFSADGGTLEYAGNTDYSVLAELPQVNNLVFSGSGQRLLPNLDVDILGDLTIAGGDVVNEESRLMTIRGNLTGTGGSFEPRQGTVIFRGAGLQTISGDFTDAVNRSLYNMEVDNTSGIRLASPVEVENVITFTNGVVTTSDAALLTILNSSNAAVVDASRLRYVNGPMQKKINGGTLFDFPVGDDYRYGNIGVKPQTTGLWTAQYFDQAPTQTDGVTYVSQNEYWSVRSEVADNAQIKLRWDAESGVNPDNPDFLVITRTTGNWSELSYVNKIGDVSGGTVYTEDALAHSTNERMFTFGSGSIEPFTWKGNATGAPDDWFTPANWTSNLVPSAANPAIVDDTYPTGPDPVIGEGMDAYCSTLKISEGRTVTVLKGATLEVAQSLDNLGTIVLESTNSSLSSLMLPEGATSGDVNVKLTLAANEKFYLSSPVINTSLQDFYPDGDADNDFVYVFREEPTWGWIRVNDSYLSDPVKAELGTMEAVAAMYLDGLMLDFSGSVNTSNVIKESDGQGYFLLGNPYPVAIDWEDPIGWERDGFSNTMYSYVTINDIRIFQTYNNGGDLLPGFPVLEMPEGYDEGNVSHIPPYQSVWLRQDITGPMNITVKPSARVKESDAPLKSVSTDDFTYDLIRIKADNDFLFDGTVIYFNENFSESVGDEDSDKRFNSSVEVPELYTRINNRAYAINGLPALSDPQYSIPLSVRNRVEREVTFTVDLSQFNVNYEVFLEDRETGTWINMREVNTYTYAPVQMGDDHDRFVLHFEQRQDVPTGINESESATDGGIHIYGMGDYTRILISPELLQSAEAVIEILDVSGRVMNRVTTGSAKTEIYLPESNGVFVVRVNAGGTVKTEKVVR